MSARRVTALVAVFVSLISGNTLAQHVVPSALLTIDQNRPTVVDRIAGEWGDRLVSSNAGISSSQLREILSGLRADHLLAASLAGNVEGLRNVVAGALVHTDAAIFPALMHAKALGDTGDDLVYTPIVPCRILDTRHGTTPPYNAQMVGGSAFPVAANLSNFAPQGGSATNCGLPSGAGAFAAIAVTLTVLNPNFDAFLAASSSSNFATLTQSVVMDFSANKGLANTAIVPVDGTVKFYLGLPAQVTTHVIADAVGYLRPPTNYGGTHTITGLDATDSGGFTNTASGDYSTVAGGASNTAGGEGSTIGGGAGNTTNSFHDTIAGGFANTASSTRSTIGGGEGNIASASDSTVAGGSSNTASGIYSTVAGGLSNTASGEASFAAGFLANANGSGCFVFSDFSSNNKTSCFNPNVFVARALGGFFLLTGGTNDFNYTGAELPSGSSAWTTYSDRNGKENVDPVDPRAVLDKVVAIPISTWNWKTQKATIRHLGPMAQDFYAAFGLGETDKGISTVDGQGVALAAIQGLHQTVRQQMRAKDKEIAQLKRKLQALEAKLGL